MRTLSLSFLMICGLTFSSHWAAAQSRIAEVPRGASPKLDSERIEEIDPDLGGEVEPIEAAAGGPAGGAVEDCHIIGAFTTQFTFPNRYRGNLYTISDSGVFLREISAQLALTGPVDLYFSVHRKKADGTYEQLDINTASASLKHIVLVGVTGNNQAAWFTSGLLNSGTGIELEPAQYAIGVAWGNASVRFARDSGQSYPKPFEVGTIAGSVSRELSGGEPPLGDSPSFSTFTGGVYSQELCFVPAAGACCQSSTATCVNVFEEECTGPGSFFHGQRTTCKDTLCNFGACCFKCGNADEQFAAKCGDNYVTESCTAAGGIRFWEGISCPADGGVLCPKLVGSCCHGGTCTQNECEAQCTAPTNPGVYRGDGTDCTPDFCRGACCRSSGCSSSTQSSCTTFGGTFKGYGTSCLTLPPELECGGACCFGFDASLDQCTEVDNRGMCAYDYSSGEPSQIAYLGDNTSCPQLCGQTTNFKGCCLPDGRCINATNAVCTSATVQGTPQTGTCQSMSQTTCANLVARCCYGDGTCDERTPASCSARGGSSVAGQLGCGPNACNTFAGACCGTAVGECTMLTPADCSALGGFYQGDTSDCANASATCPGFGACCRGNGDCLDGQSQAQCANVGGAYQGPGSTCLSPDVDCETRGACCAVTGTCLRTTAGTCAELEGQFKGVGEPCTPGLCPSGACCLPDECRPRTPAACASDGGDYKGDGTTCGLATCIIQGACCRQAACTVEPPETCTGTYLGDDTTCGTNACSTGACCRLNGTCDENVQQGACAGQGERFALESDCDEVECAAQGACCDQTTCELTAENNCTGIFRGIGVECSFDTCAAQGACCNGTACTVATQSDCSSGGGVYQGDNTACETGTCAPATGACCNGAACTVVTESACTTGGATYQGDNTACDAGTCAATPTGACCNGSVCTETTQAECSATYQGNGTDCSPNPCPTGGACTAILSSVPENCFIDPRRPYPPFQTGTSEGRTSVQLTFDCDTANHQPSDYAVTIDPAGPGPTVSSVLSGGTSITLTFSQPVPAGAWTCVRYVPTNLSQCFGFLPGDVSANRTTAPADLLTLIDDLNNVLVPELPLERCDIDRSGTCAPADLITLIDLLNGANSFIIWNQRMLPACPSAAP